MGTGGWLTALVDVLSALLFGALIPWLAMRLAVKALASSPGARTSNFRGRPVVYGLGIVWVVWLIGATLSGAIGIGFHSSALAVDGLALLVAVAFSFGLFDDAYGTGAAKGFRGHVRALRGGELTTGGLKLIGISAASLVYALAVAELDPLPWAAGSTFSSLAAGWSAPLLTVGVTVLAAAAIALTGNVMNLTDLRPGRASKAYLLLLGVGFVASVARVFASAPSPSALDAAQLAGSVVDLIWLVGPVVAVMGLDLRERGMLGDAGANPMGVLAGAYVVGSLGPIGVAVYFAAVLALNAASEKVSFSRVIESNAALSWVDNLGRLKDGSGE